MILKKNLQPPGELANYVNQERLTFLVDGVFAITVTLLVLELRPPELETTNLAAALQAMIIWMFWAYVVKNRKQFASNSEPRLLAITSQVWLIIAIGWLVSILLGFMNVYIAYVGWIVLPNAVGFWGSRKRRGLQVKHAK